MIDYNAVYCPWCLTVMDVTYDDAFAPVWAECPECDYEIDNDVLTLGQMLAGWGDDVEYNCVNLTKWTRFTHQIARGITSPSPSRRREEERQHPSGLEVPWYSDFDIPAEVGDHVVFKHYTSCSGTVYDKRVVDGRVELLLMADTIPALQWWSAERVFPSWLGEDLTRAVRKARLG